MHVEAGSGMNFLVAATGAIPAVLLMLYFDWLDRKRPEPASLRYGVMGVGILSVIPAIIVEGVLMAARGKGMEAGSYADAGYNSFVVAGATEEAMKIASVFVVVWYSRFFDERMDGLVYGARAGLGFALLENCAYIYQAAPTNDLAITWILRALFAVPGHAMWSGMIGYCAARKRFDKAGPGLLGGYAIALFFHGLYDFSIFVQTPLRKDGLDMVGNVFLGVPLLLSIVGWFTVRRMARTALTLDDAAEAWARANPQAGARQAQQWPPQYPPGHAPSYGYNPQFPYAHFKHPQWVQQQRAMAAQQGGAPQAPQQPQAAPQYWNWPAPPRR